MSYDVYALLFIFFLFLHALDIFSYICLSKSRAFVPYLLYSTVNKFVLILYKAGLLWYSSKDTFMHN